MSQETPPHPAALQPHEVLVHGTCVALEDWSVLLRGPSGSGKSDLGLRLINAGGTLVSDDQVVLQDSGGFLRASPPQNIAGLLEVRGVGILKMAHTQGVPLGLLIDLVQPDKVPRLPDAQTDKILGVDLPVLALCAFESSAPAKVMLALRSLID
jgi:serine kinase of HPr protein (carbohydrate metabolism regulator)